MSELKDDQNFAAEQLQEAIQADETGAPNVNVQSDYDRSKEFSTPSGNDSEAETFDSISSGSSFNNPSGAAKGTEAGNPEGFLDMAKDVGSDSKE